MDYPIVVEGKDAMEVSGFQWNSRRTYDVIFKVHCEPERAVAGMATKTATENRRWLRGEVRTSLDMVSSLEA